MVDALAAELVQGDPDVLGRPVLPGVERAAQAGRAAAWKAGAKAAWSIPRSTESPPTPRSSSRSHPAANAHHLLGVGRARRLVDVEDEAAGDVEVGVRHHAPRPPVPPTRW